MRFGCGALAGIALGLSVMFTRASGMGSTLLVCLGLAIVLGIAAALFGDRFWYWLWQVTGWLRW